MTYSIVNGRMVASAEAVVSIQDRGFRYGDGVFETIAVRASVPYRFEWHMERLAGGLQAIKIPFAVDNMREHCRQLLRKNAMLDGILRIQVTRGAGGRGYLPDSNDPTFVIETAAVPQVLTSAISLWQSSYSKISERTLPVRYKLCQGLNSALARMEAVENQCFDALLLNEHGHICETSSANLFWFSGGTLYTPSLSCGILEGATRAVVMQASPYPVHEVEAGIEMLPKAEALFITNTAWQAIGIERLLPLNHRWNSAAISEQFRQLLAKDREHYCHKHREEW